MTESHKDSKHLSTSYLSTSRRAFLQQSSLVILAAGMTSLVSQANAVMPKPRSPVINLSKDRQLGRNGPMISVLGLGCMGMSEFYGAIDQQAVQRTLARAVDLGVNMFDSADMYGRGQNEEMLGTFMARQRDKIILATKFGIVRDEQGVHMDNRPAYVKASCEASLRRLKTDYIDIFYVHRIAPEHPVEEMMSAMAELVREGKIRTVGLSEASPATIRRAHAIHPIAAVQTEYSLLSRGPEQTIIPTCRELGIAFVPYAPLCRGLLSGRAPNASELADDDFRKQLPRFQPENFITNQTLVNQLTPIAARKECSLAQLSLAWLLAQGSDIIPIPGTRQVTHLDENVASRFVELSATELQEINLLFPLGKAAGERYSDDELKTVGL